MDAYKLRDLGITVGMFQEYSTFEEVLDTLFKPALDKLGLNSIQDLVEELTDDNGQVNEDKAMKLCMDNLDGINADDDAPEAEWGDSMYDHAAGK